MKVVFRAAKMIERVKREGKGDMLDETTLAFINSLDGKEADTYNWASVVNGENLALIDGKTYVNVADCD